MPEIQFTEASGRYYKVLNGTFYDPETPDQLVKFLEECREPRRRLHFDWGDPVTGRSWGEENDVEGSVGRTSGEVKSPILVKTAKSHGGGLISTDRIVGITGSKHSQGITYYRHPFYKPAYVWDKGEVLPKDAGDPNGSNWQVHVPKWEDVFTQQYVAGFRTEVAARRWLDKRITHEPSTEARHRTIAGPYLSFAFKSLERWGWSRDLTIRGYTDQVSCPWQDGHMLAVEEAMLDEINRKSDLYDLRNALLIYFNRKDNCMELWQRFKAHPPIDAVPWMVKPGTQEAMPLSRHDVIRILAKQLWDFWEWHYWLDVVQADDTPFRGVILKRDSTYDREKQFFEYAPKPHWLPEHLDQMLMITALTNGVPSVVARKNGSLYGWSWEGGTGRVFAQPRRDGYWLRFLRQENGMLDSRYEKTVKFPWQELKAPPHIPTANEEVRRSLWDRVTGS